MMRSQSSLLYRYRLIVAGMKVDYYGWALVLGVGWQGWKQGLGSIKKVTQDYSYRAIRYKHCFHPCQPTPQNQCPSIIIYLQTLTFPN